MPEPQVAIIVDKVLKGQVNETRVTDQDRDRQLACVVLVAGDLRTIFCLDVRRKFVRRQFGVLADLFEFLA